MEGEFSGGLRVKGFPEKSGQTGPSAHPAESGGPGGTDAIKRLRAAQVRLLYKNAPFATIATVVNSTLMALILWRVSPPPAIIAWLLCNLALTTIRHLTLRRYLRIRDEDFDPRRMGNRFIAGVALAGIAFGSAGALLFPTGSVVHQVFLAFVLGGMVAGSAGAYSAIMGAYLAYSLPVLLPIIVRILAQGGVMHITMAGMFLLFFVLMTAMTRQMHFSVVGSLRLRFENMDLLGRLRAEVEERRRTGEALMESEERFRKLSDAPFEGIVIHKGGLILDINRSIAAMFGYRPSEAHEIIGKNILEFVAPEYLEMVREKIASGSESPYECAGVKKDGAAFPMEVQGKSIPYKGQAARVTAIRDITERKKAEEALRTAFDGLERRVEERTAQLAEANKTMEVEVAERRRAEEALRVSEAAYRMLFESNPHPMWVYDLETLAFLEVNRTTLRKYGYSREEFLSMSLKDIHSPEELPALLESVPRAAEGPESHMTWRHVKKDGSVMDVETSSHALVFNDRRAGLLMACDITERRRAEEALRKSEGSLARAQQIARLGSWELDTVKNEVVMSDELCRIFGVTPDEPKAYEALTGLIPPGYRESVEKAVEAALNDNAPYNVDFPIIRQDGSERLLHSEGEVTFDDEDRPVRMFGITQDVTERRRAEEKIKSAYERTREILEKSPFGVFVVDDRGIVEYANPAMVGISGSSHEQFVGMDILKLPTYIETGLHEKIKAALEGEPFFTGPLEYSSHYGKKTAVRNFTGIPYEVEGVGKALVFVEDITERKRAEEELVRREEYFRSLTENAMDIIAAMDGKGLLRYVSPSVRRVLGYDPEEVIGWNILDLIHPEDIPTALEKISRVLATPGFLGSIEVRYRHNDGSWRILEAVGRSLRDESGALGIILNARDVTERVLAGEEIKRERDKAQRYLDIAGVIFVVIGADRKVILINRKGSEILGYSEDEVVGKDWFENFIPESIRHATEEVFGKLMAGEVVPVECFENKVLAKDGQERLIAWHNTVLRDEREGITAILSSGEDITERKESEERIKAQLGQLNALRSIDMSISSSFDLRVTLDILLEEVISQLKVEAADVLLLNPHTMRLEYAAGKGFRTDRIRQVGMRLGECYAGKAAKTRERVIIPDISKEKPAPTPGREGYAFSQAFLVVEEGFRAYAGVPLIAKGAVKGVLEVFHRATL